MIHELKTWPEPFQAIWDHKKRFEFRKNDRWFKVDDFLLLLEWDPTTEEYSGRWIAMKITYLICEGFGIPEGYCVMSLDYFTKDGPGL